MAHLILFEDKDFKGRHMDVFQSQQSLGNFNKITSSFKILAGHWEFFIDTNQKSPRGASSLGPNAYPWVEDVGIPNDAIQSVRLVQG